MQMKANVYQKLWRPLRRFYTQTLLNLWGEIPAQGYWQSAQTYHDQGKHIPDCGYEVLIPAHQETITPPWTITSILPTTFEQTKFLVPPGFCYQIPQARVASSYGDVIAPDGQLIYDGSQESGRQPQERSVCTLKFPKARVIPQIIGVIASVKGGSNYYHFLVDVLPRIYLLKQSRFWPEIELFYANKFLPGLQKLKSLLSMAGLTEKPIFWADAHGHLQGKSVIATSLTGLPGMSYFKPRWVFEFLRATYLSQAKSPDIPRPKLYISRSRASFRRVENEAEVLDYLMPLGYQPVWLEDLSFPEQVGLFQQAEFIIAPHGAGLANLIWCQPGAKIVEFFSPEYLPECYWVIAKQIGLHYGFLVGRRPSDRVSTEEVRNHPIWVDLGDLAQAVDWLSSV
jgi:capsular polysaccharide biosynthesis protein